MIVIIEDILKTTESFFKSYPFSKDFTITCLSVIFGGLITLLLNRGSIRKQAYFDLQYTILSQLLEQINELEKSIENLEIVLSFGNRKTELVKDEIISVQKQALVLNEVFREKRLQVHKYISGVMLEESAQFPGEIYQIIYDSTKGNFSNPQMKEIISDADIEKLRKLTKDARKLKNKVSDSLEVLIFPSMFSKIRRKLKKIKVFCGNVYGVWKVRK